MKKRILTAMLVTIGLVWGLTSVSGTEPSETQYRVDVSRIHYQDGAGREIDYDFSSGAITQDVEGKDEIEIPDAAVLSRGDGEDTTTFLWGEPLLSSDTDAALVDNSLTIGIDQAEQYGYENEGTWALGASGTTANAPGEWTFEARVGNFSGTGAENTYYGEHIVFIGAGSSEDNIFPVVGLTWFTGWHENVYYEDVLVLRAEIENDATNEDEWQSDAIILQGHDPANTVVDVKVQVTGGATLVASYRLNDGGWTQFAQHTLSDGQMPGFPELFPFVTLETGIAAGVTDLVVGRGHDTGIPGTSDEEHDYWVDVGGNALTDLEIITPWGEEFTAGDYLPADWSDEHFEEYIEDLDVFIEAYEEDDGVRWIEVEWENLPEIEWDQLDGGDTELRVSYTDGSWSGTLDFSSSPMPTEEPVITYPSHGETGVELQPTFTWEEWTEPGSANPGVWQEVEYAGTDEDVYAHEELDAPSDTTSWTPTGELYPGAEYEFYVDFHHAPTVRVNGIDVPVISYQESNVNFTTATASELPSDKFDDNEKDEMWSLFEGDPENVWLEETDGRLEAGSTAQESHVDATYYSRGWRLDTSSDFAMQVDWHFSNTGCEDAGLYFATFVPGTPSWNVPPGEPDFVKSFLSINVDYDDGAGVYVDGATDGVEFYDDGVPYTAETGRFFVSYDAANDRIFLSVNGYWRDENIANGDWVFDGILQDAWGEEPVAVGVGFYNDGAGEAFTDGNAYFDNFEVTEGTVVTPPTRTLTVDSNPNAGVPIDVQRDDNDDNGDGTTPFTRIYDEGIPVILTAPVEDGDGNAFVEWQCDGNTFSTQRSIEVSGTADQSWTAHFSVPAQTPGQPTAEVPTGELELGKVRPQFDWTSTGAEATWHKIHLNRNGRTYLTKWVKGETVWTPSDDLPAGDYEWWVRGWNPDGFGDWSESETFTIAAMIPDAIPQIAPEGEQDGNDLSFRWDQRDQRATWYRLWISHPHGGAWHNQWYERTDENEATVDLSGHPGGSSSWWIRGWGPDGFGPWSGPMEFSTPSAEPEQPTLIEPGPEQEALAPVTLRYEAARADWYRVFLRRDGVKELDEWTQETTFDADNLPFGNYSWWVAAWNRITGATVWSDRGDFTIAAMIPDAIPQIAPEGEQNENDLTFRWDQTDQRATWYRLWVSDPRGGTWHNQWYERTDDDEATVDLSGHPGGSSSWWIRGWGPDGFGPWSGPMEFSTPSAEPE